MVAWISSSCSVLPETVPLAAKMFENRVGCSSAGIWSGTLHFGLLTAEAEETAVEKSRLGFLSMFLDPNTDPFPTKPPRSGEG